MCGQNTLRCSVCAMGMKDPSTFVLRVAKEVSIDLTLVGKIGD